MKFLFSEKSLVVIFCLLFAASSAFLFWQNERELDPNRGKAWWTLSFAALAVTDSLDFVIENHGPQATFRYRIVTNKNITVEGALELKNGEIKTVTPEITAVTGVRTTVSVIKDQEKKEIYR